MVYHVNEAMDVLLILTYGQTRACGMQLLEMTHGMHVVCNIAVDGCGS
jgi:hypothetical protein